MNKFFTFIILIFSAACYSQSFDKAWGNLEDRIRKGEYLSTQEKTNFLSKYEKDLKSHPLEKSILCNGLGHDAYDLENYPEAITQFNTAIELAQQVGDTVYVALYKYDLASLYNHVGYYTNAEPLFLSSLPTLSVYYGQSSIEYTMRFKVLTEMYVEMGKYNEAKMYNDALLYYFKTLKGEKDHEYLVCLNNDARISEGFGNYQKALEIFKQLMEIHASLNPIDTADYITIINNTAEAQRHVSNYYEAIDLQNKALNLSFQFSQNSAISLATIYNNIGLCYKAVGEYQKAEEAFDNSIAIYKKLNLTFIPDYTNPLSNKSDLYRILGRNKQAGDLLQEVLEIRKTSLGTKHVNYANALSNFALVRIADYNASGLQEHIDDAEKYLLEAKDIYKEILGEYHPNYANCLNNLAMLYINQKRYKEAEVLKLKALEIIKELAGEDNERYANILGGTISLYEGLGNYTKAIENVEKANAIIKTKFGEKHIDYIDGTFNLAYLKWKVKDYKAAQNLFYKSLDAYKTQFNSYFDGMSENDQFSFYNVLGDRFESFTSFVISYTKLFPKDNHDELLATCFNNQLFLKSILLNQSINARKSILNSKDTALINLYNKWLANKQILAGIYRDTNFENTYWKESDLQTETDRLEKDIKAKTIAFNRTNANLTYKDILNHLQKNEAAIYIMREDIKLSDTTSSLEYIALLLDKSHSSPQLIRFPKSNLFENEFIQYYSEKIENKEEDKLSYNRLWKPIADKLTGINTLYLSADGIYNQINLLTLQEPTTNKFVLDQIAVSILPNLSYLVSDNINQNSNKTAELFGYPDYEYDFSQQKSIPNPINQIAVNRFGFSELPPLPGTQTEVDNISASLATANWKVNLYTKEKATEAELKKVKSPKVLHIATHGFFLRDIMESEDKSILGFETNSVKSNPLLRSGIMMAGASIVARDTSNAHEDQDGIFTAYEASLLDLHNTDLVVLSACETGLGVTINNQGVFGLQRAFYIAGAKSLIMSLWVVDDDATQLLMSEFYKDWASHPTAETISQSFKKAQNEVRKKYPHPYYWGAFVLLGK